MVHKNRGEGKRLPILLVVVFVVGVAVMLYPSIANLWNTHFQKTLIANYESDLEGMAASGDTSYVYELEKARAYNNELWPAPNPEGFTFLKEEDPEPEYMDCLNLRGDGIMGYVSVPKIDIALPLYHSTEETELLNGAGHLEGTSLPIGGLSTHSVIAAHRGLPGAELFTNLDKMEIGDHFFLSILNEQLAYEVDQILVVEPEDVSDLVIVEGEDLCTLLTCTPYGVNTQRLLVRGHRVEIKEEEIDEEAAFTMKLEYWLLLAGIAVAAIGITILLTGRKKRKNEA